MVEQERQRVECIIGGIESERGRDPYQSGFGEPEQTPHSWQRRSNSVLG